MEVHVFTNVQGKIELKLKRLDASHPHLKREKLNLQFFKFKTDLNFFRKLNIQVSNRSYVSHHSASPFATASFQWDWFLRKQWLFSSLWLYKWSKSGHPRSSSCVRTQLLWYITWMFRWLCFQKVQFLLKLLMKFHQKQNHVIWSMKSHWRRL